MTTNRAGKMKMIVGKRILVPAFWAISSARCRRLTRSVSAWTRIVLDEAGAEAVGLDDDRGQAADFLQVGALGQVPERLSGRKTELDLALDDVQLVGQERVGCPQVFGHVAECRGQAQSPLQADHHHIEGVGKGPAKTHLTGGLPVVEPEARADHSGRAQDRADEHTAGERPDAREADEEADQRGDWPS